MLLGNGDGTFQPAVPTMTPPTYAGQLVVGDFNGDGKLDVASGAGDFLLLGNGDGTFQPFLFLGAGGVGIAAGDFNNDGRLDLAVDGATILLNRGSQLTSTTTTLTSSANPSRYGQTITFFARVMAQSGTPTGTVSFIEGTTTLGSASLSGGVASLSTSALGAGRHFITASYSGDSNFGASSSVPLKQRVRLAATVTSLTSSGNPVLLHQPVTYTATVASQYGGAVTGTVTFRDGNGVTVVPLSGGIASLTKTYSTPGAHLVSATYSGDANNLAGASNTLLERVEKVR